MSAMASNSSCSSSSTPKWMYDVFLSFRGEDTRKTFLSHLYKDLVLKGIHTFKDDERLERGKSISPTLLQSIRESRFAIIVFSKNYATSEWCLNEVATIMECKEKLGQTVIPIFYDVDPSQVRQQTGSFAESFAKHEADFINDDKKKVERWRKAFHDASRIAGHDLQNMYNGYEMLCIQQVVNDISTKLHQALPTLQKNLVGLELQLEQICTLLSMESDDVRFIGIWGMGGIGKTTIARAVFAKFLVQFEGACFLADIRENQGRRGLQGLQATLLSKILKEGLVDINDVYEGMDMIIHRLRFKKVLLILDDVDHLEQLDKLAGDRDWFGNGSRIIITTRDMRLLRSHKVDETYEVDKLHDYEAIQLFSRHAFKKQMLEKGFEDLSWSIVRYAGGLPLALKVLGSFLCGLEASEWRSTIEKLKDVPEKEILTKLKISFDGLDDGDKKIFLDIACLFRKKKKDYVIHVLKSCDMQPAIAIRVLIERSLLFISNGLIEMHDLIQEMGCYIASQENPRCRVWRLEDVDNVFGGNMDAEVVEALLVPSKHRYSYNENISCNLEAFKRMRRLKLLIIEDFERVNGLMLRISFGLSIPINCLPNSLRWLDFSFYPLHFLPEVFQAPNLVGIHMPQNSLQKWTIMENLCNLTYLDLSSSIFLIETPDFERLPNLESVNLSGCKCLEEVHPSLGLLKKLISLVLNGCGRLEKLPILIQTGSLELLDLGYCEKLEMFPEICGNMPHLLDLELVYTGIKELPSSVVYLSGLTKLRLVECENLVCLPSSLCGLKNLKVLELEHCPKLKCLPENLGNLPQLEKLHVRHTAIFEPPRSIAHLRKLESLSFQWRSFQGSICCFVLPKLSAELCSLTSLELVNLDILDEGLPNDLGCLPSLIYMNLRGNNFVRLPESIKELPHLQYLDITHCWQLEALPELPASIKELHADAHLALESNLADLATTYTELYSVSFSIINPFKIFLIGKSKWNFLPNQMFHQFVSSPVVKDLHRKATFSVVLPETETEIDTSRWFNYQKRDTNKISINLNPSWYNCNFWGFAVCCYPSKYELWESCVGNVSKHSSIIAKLAHKDDGRQVLKTASVIALSTDDPSGVCGYNMSFTYIPFGSLWPEYDVNTINPNDYSIFEACLDWGTSTYWGVRLLYKDEAK